MDFEAIREWLIQNGIPADELDDVPKAPIATDVINLKEKSKTSEDIYNELLLDEGVTLEELKTARINYLKDQCSNSIYEGFVSASTGYEFGFNQHDQSNMSQQMLVIVADTNNAITTVQWKTKNHGVVDLTKGQFLGIIEEAKNHKINQQMKYWMKEELVLVAATIDEIKEINW